MTTRKNKKPAPAASVRIEKTRKETALGKTEPKSVRNEGAGDLRAKRG